MADKSPAPLVGIQFANGNVYNLVASPLELELLQKDSSWCRVEEFLLRHNVLEKSHVVFIQPGGFDHDFESEDPPVLPLGNVSPVPESARPSWTVDFESEVPPVLPLGNVSPVPESARPSWTVELVQEPVSVQAEDPFTSTPFGSLAATADCDDDDRSIKFPVRKVRMLLAAYAKHRHMFANNCIRRKDVWRKIAEAMNASGLPHYSGFEVDKKFRALKCRYKKHVDNNRSTGRDRRTWVWFDDLDQLFASDPAVHPEIIITAGAEANTVEVDVGLPSTSAGSSSSSPDRSTPSIPVSASSTPPTAVPPIAVTPRGRNSRLPNGMERAFQAFHNTYLEQSEKILETFNRFNDLFQERTLVIRDVFQPSGSN